jgi:hypothetical protein
MIAHQHVRIQPVAKSLLALLKKIQITLAILIVFEDVLPLIAATHDMMERPGKMYPRLSGHNAATILKSWKNSNKVCLTPIQYSSISV